MRFSKAKGTLATLLDEGRVGEAWQAAQSLVKTRNPFDAGLQLDLARLCIETNEPLQADLHLQWARCESRPQELRHQTLTLEALAQRPGRADVGTRAASLLRIRPLPPEAGARTCLVMARQALQRGDLGRTRRWARMARHRTEEGPPLLLAAAERLLGVVCCREGDLDKGNDHLATARGIAFHRKAPGPLWRIMLDLAALARLRKDLHLARTRLRHARKAAAEGRCVRALARVRLEEAELALATGDEIHAVETCALVREHAEGDGNTKALAYLLEGRARMAMGQPEEAALVLCLALGVAQDACAEALVARSLVYLAVANLRLGRKGRSRALASRIGSRGLRRLAAWERPLGMALLDAVGLGDGAERTREALSNLAPTVAFEARKRGEEAGLPIAPGFEVWSRDGGRWTHESRDCLPTPSTFDLFLDLDEREVVLDRGRRNIDLAGLDQLVAIMRSLIAEGGDLPYGKLYETVWRQPFNPELNHINKIHVAKTRLHEKLRLPLVVARQGGGGYRLRGELRLCMVRRRPIPAIPALTKAQKILLRAVTRSGSLKRREAAALSGLSLAATELCMETLGDRGLLHRRGKGSDAAYLPRSAAA